MLERIRRMKEQDGFTLIELLIVIIILGILAAIVVFGVSTFRKNAQEKACQADEKQVEVAGQAYVAKNGTSASTGPDLVAADFLREYPTSADYDINYSKVGDDFTVTTTPTDCVF